MNVDKSKGKKNVVRKKKKSLTMLKFTGKNNKIQKVMPLSESPFEEKELCCSIRFYDNQPDIIQQFRKSKKYIESIQVCNDPNKFILSGATASWYTIKFLEKFPHNVYAQYLYSKRMKEPATTVGLSFRDCKNLQKWSNRPKPEKKIAIFDWDGTLSVVEGIIIPKNKEMTELFKGYGITNLDVALYYAGGIQRLEYLKNMFHLLDIQGIEVYILTNNPTAACDWKKLNDDGIGPESRDNFYNVAKEIIPDLKKENVLCGFETNCFKPDTFSNNEYLRNIYYRIQHWYFTHPGGTK